MLSSSSKTLYCATSHAGRSSHRRVPNRYALQSLTRSNCASTRSTATWTLRSQNDRYSTQQPHICQHRTLIEWSNLNCHRAAFSTATSSTSSASENSNSNSKTGARATSTTFYDRYCAPKPMKDNSVSSSSTSSFTSVHSHSAGPKVSSKLRKLSQRNKNKANSSSSVSSSRSSSGSTTCDYKYVRNKSRMDVPGPLQFSDFLEADVNRDGRVSAVEWEAYQVKKQKALTGDIPNALHFELPMSAVEANKFLESTGLALTVNGMRYDLILKPRGSTKNLIREQKQKLDQVLKEYYAMQTIKAPLDAQASVHCGRIMTLSFLYLIGQSVLIAKLTFFSRFGWDVMEPITYFLTFGTGLLAFAFFQFHKIEYSYPALAALITQRKARRLYAKHNFDWERYEALEGEVAKQQQRLDLLIPPLTMLRGSDMDDMGLHDGIDYADEPNSSSSSEISDSSSSFSSSSSSGSSSPDTSSDSCPRTDYVVQNGKVRAL